MEPDCHSNRTLEKWLASRVHGVVKSGTSLEFSWRNGRLENFQIQYVGEKHSAFRLEWRYGTIVRFYLHGKMTTLTLEAEYQHSVIGRARQIAELPQWAF